MRTYDKKTIEDNRSRGLAVVMPNATVNGRECVAVGIHGTKEAIALCGFSDDEDFDTSMANAIQIATLWNKADNEEKS